MPRLITNAVVASLFAAAWQAGATVAADATFAGAGTTSTVAPTTDIIAGTAIAPAGGGGTSGVVVAPPASVLVSGAFDGASGGSYAPPSVVNLRASAPVILVGGSSPLPGNAVGALLPGRGAAFSSGGGTSFVASSPDGSSTVSMSTSSSGDTGAVTDPVAALNALNPGSNPAAAAVNAMMGGNAFGPAFGAFQQGRRLRAAGAK